MFEGVVRILCDVRHVPDVEKNLISLGTLEFNRFGYKFEGGIMKVINGAMVVMKGQKNYKNIYKLLGNTVVGGVAFMESESDHTVCGICGWVIWASGTCYNFIIKIY